MSLKYLFNRVIIIIQLSLVIIFFSCSRNIPAPLNNQPSNNSSNQGNGSGNFGSSVSFWVINIYDDYDLYWFYPQGVFNIIVGGETKTLCYTLNPNANPSCNEPTVVTFNVNPGTQIWKAVRIGDGSIIKQGSITVSMGQCVVYKIDL